MKLGTKMENYQKNCRKQEPLLWFHFIGIIFFFIFLYGNCVRSIYFTWLKIFQPNFVQGAASFDNMQTIKDYNHFYY